MTKKTLFSLVLFFLVSGACLSNQVMLSAFAAGVSVEKEDIPNSTKNLEYTKKLLGKAISEDKQDFETHIAHLLRLSLDDIYRGYGTSKIDMAARRKYFSDVGWQMYEKYVSKHKAILKSKKNKYEHPQTKPRFVYGTQEYKGEGTKSHFSAKLSFYYASGCMHMSSFAKHEIDLEVSGNFENPQDMIIEKWLVDFAEEE